MDAAYLEDLLKKEKELRQQEEVDAIESRKVLCDIIERVKNQEGWEALSEWVQTLAKRRRQPKQAIVGMIQQCMDYLDSLPEDHPLLKTLRQVTEGKIFLEVEFARLTRRLVNIKHKQGNTKEASDLLQEVQVETYGSMDKHEKLEFLLEQLRLLLKLEEYTKFQIISNKVNRKVLDEPGMEEEKVRFLNYMIEYFNHMEDYMQAALSHKTIFETKNKQIESPFALQQMVVNLLLVEFNAEQADLLRRVVDHEELDSALANLVKILLGKEIGWLSSEAKALIPSEKLSILLRRINQHNIRIVQNYYSRITLARLAQILSLSIDEAEAELRDMVSYMGFTAKINRPEGYVNFSKAAQTQSELNNWGSDIYELLQKTEEITHLIHREHIISS